MVFAKSSPRLSLNNPSNIWPCSNCSKEICHTNDKQREIERERETASELDAKWYGNCRKQGTTGWISIIGFVVLWMCTTVFAWFTPSLMDCRVWSQVVAFGGPYRFTVFCAYFWQKTPAILKWSSTILTVTHMAHAYKSAYLTSLWNRPNQRHVRPGVMRCYERCFNSEAGPCTEAQASTIWMKRHVIAKPVRGSIMISSIRTSDSEQVNNKD